jgi:hypothetical protein
LGSLLLHGAFAGYLVWRTSTPDIDLEFAMPSQVEFGLTEGVEAAPRAPASAPSAPEPSSEPSSSSGEAGGAGATVDAGRPVDGGTETGAEPLDAGRPSRRARDAGQPLEVAATDAGSGPTVASAGDAGAGELPPGAQLALRMDMDAIKASPLASDVRRLLAKVPDWQIMLADSDIAPLEDLDRLLIAHPGATNRWGGLLASHTVVAGRHHRDPGYVRSVVSRMAAARGVEASWNARSGIRVAPWPDLAETKRIVAMVGAEHFAISRPEDLPRLLAIAQARAERDGGTSVEPERWAAELLSMPEGAALTFEIEGARRFLRRGRIEMFPTRGRLALSYRTGGGRARIELEASGSYESAEQAGRARDFWDRYRERYASNALVALMDMSAPLRDAELEASGRRVTLHAEARLRHVRVLLGFVEDFLERYSRQRFGPRGSPSGSGTPSAGSGTPSDGRGTQ